MGLHSCIYAAMQSQAGCLVMPTGTITGLRAQAHDNQRVNVFLDGTFAIGVSLNTIAREGLYVGKILDEAAWVRLEDAEGADKAFQAALPLLNQRPRSSAELRQRLARKQFPAASIEAAIARLADLGLVDDAAFARSYIENRLIHRPRGARALRAELSRRGIARDVVEQLLEDEDLAVADSEQERANTVARAAARRYANAPDRATFQRRLGGYLQRRGFGFETIGPIIEQLWDELQDRGA